MIPLTRDDLLEIAAEEGCEIGKAAIKCLRFGYGRYYPGYGVNSDHLAAEFGELLAIIEALDLPNDIIEKHRSEKIERATRAKNENPRDQSFIRAGDATT